MGFAALLARMPQKFVAQHKKVQERACHRREAQARRLRELDLTRPSPTTTTAKGSASPEWQDTVADFTTR
ncbi:hypothetical protein ACG04R_22845 [Roseateles sp. BYS78W]|uniref:Uncharacterized protein n=1 Tax=Pelomonas candidula TaxID=3299025 RepID=A0ABW7HIE8_9BURK